MRQGAAAALILTLLAAFPATARDDAVEAGRNLSEAFHRGEIGAIWNRMTPTMRDALGDEAALSRLREGIEAQFGAETGVLSEDAQAHGEYRIYLRTAQHATAPAPLLTQWTLDRDDRVAGFFVRLVQEPAASRHLDYETRAEMRLPFDGEWYVFWGGRTPETNYHVIDPGQRFAYDFFILRDGSSKAEGSDAPEDHHCWDAPILAPAGARVAAAVDGFADNRPGQLDPANPAGNHVVLDLGDGEFAFLAHLRQGSVAVAEGDRVARGQEIGRCGNSGNSSEPHLHFHLQNTPTLGAGEGLPGQFRDYVADGKPVARGEPLRGQTVAPGG